MENYFELCYIEKIIGYALFVVFVLFWITIGTIMIIKEKKKNQ